MNVLPIADDFEALAAATVLERGPVPLKASKGTARVFKVVDKTGAVTGLVTHGKVLEGAARVAEIELAVVDGARPKAIICIDCRAIVPVFGIVPQRCATCGKKAKARAWRSRNKAVIAEKASAVYQNNKEYRSQYAKDYWAKLKQNDPAAYAERRRTYKKRYRAKQRVTP